MKNFLDRSYQRAEISKILIEKHEEFIFFVCFYGGQGVGKSELLRYIAGKYNFNVLDIETDRKIYRCPENDSSSYGFAVSLINRILEQKPNDIKKLKDFGDMNIAPPAWRLLYSLIESIPGMSKVTSAIDEEIKSAKNLESLINEHCGSQLIFERFRDYILDNIKIDEDIIILVDDIQYISNFSLEIIIAISKRLKESGSHVYIFATLLEGGDGKYIIDKIKDDERIKFFDIELGHLLPSEIQDIFKNRDLSPQLISIIYEKTKGNFEELSTYINKPNERLVEEFNAVKNDGALSYSESFVSYIEENKICELVVFVLWRLNGGSNWDIVEAISLQMSRNIHDIFTSREDIVKAAEMLNEKEFVNISSSFIQMTKKKYNIFSHSIKLSSNYNCYINEFYSALSNIDKYKNEVDLDLVKLNTMMLISKADTLEFIFNSLKDSRINSFSSGFILSVAKFMASTSVTEYNIDYMVRIAISLSRKNLFKSSIELFDHIHKSKLNIENVYIFYYEFLKSIRESGLAKDRHDINDLANLLISKSEEKEEKIKAKVLYCTVLEHLGKYREIKKIYNELNSIIKIGMQKKELSFSAIDYIKCKGLSEFHGDIINDYLSAFNYIKDNPNLFDNTSKRVRALQKACVMNQCGLSFFYKGDLKKAESFFKGCIEETSKIGLFLETPLNNLSVTFFMMGEYTAGFDIIEKAASVYNKPRYQEITIKLNKALFLSKQGKVDDAINITKKIANKESPVPDDILISIANVNMGYFYLLKNEYLKAAEHYKISSCFKYRFLDNEYRRVQDKMQQYCLIKSGYLNGVDLGDFSFIDLEECNSLSCNRTYRLDLNSMYIV